MNLQLKRCTKEDIPLLATISERTFRDAFEDQNNPDDFEQHIKSAFSLNTIRKEVLNEHAAFYFVKDKDEVLGFFKVNNYGAQTDIHDEQSLELERIYILSDYQGRGIGSWIMEQVISMARAAGKSYIWLGVWEANIKAIRFYEKLGFATFGKHPFYIGQDKQMDWLMRLQLPFKN
jgi:ribosomal protein S18 acetylase RimI-like enzyme